MTKIVNRVKALHAARSGQLPDLGFKRFPTPGCCSSGGFIEAGPIRAKRHGLFRTPVQARQRARISMQIRFISSARSGLSASV
jgi:hypothetical protein